MLYVLHCWLNSSEILRFQTPKIDYGGFTPILDRMQAAPPIALTKEVGYDSSVISFSLEITFKDKLAGFSFWFQTEVSNVADGTAVFLGELTNFETAEPSDPANNYGPFYDYHFFNTTSDGDEIANAFSFWQTFDKDTEDPFYFYDHEELNNDTISTEKQVEAEKEMELPPTAYEANFVKNDSKDFSPTAYAAYYVPMPTSSSNETIKKEEKGQSKKEEEEEIIEYDYGEDYHFLTGDDCNKNGECGPPMGLGNYERLGKYSTLFSNFRNFFRYEWVSYDRFQFLLIENRKMLLQFFNAATEFLHKNYECEIALKLWAFLCYSMASENKCTILMTRKCFRAKRVKL